VAHPWQSCYACVVNICVKASHGNPEKDCHPKTDLLRSVGDVFLVLAAFYLWKRALFFPHPAKFQPIHSSHIRMFFYVNIKSNSMCA
jgi:hypothetical protein